MVQHSREKVVSHLLLTDVKINHCGLGNTIGIKTCLIQWNERFALLSATNDLFENLMGLSTIDKKNWTRQTESNIWSGNNRLTRYSISKPSICSNVHLFSMPLLQYNYLKTNPNEKKMLRTQFHTLLNEQPDLFPSYCVNIVSYIEAKNNLQSS